MSSNEQPVMSFQIRVGANLQYKVWVHIERHEDGDYEDIGLPDQIGMFASLQAAEAFVRTLPGWRPERRIRPDP
jgi:hypothetical protein